MTNAILVDIETRDSSLSNGVILEQVIKPSLARGHERFAKHDARLGSIESKQDQAKGALWAFGVIGGLVAIILAALPFLVR